MISRKEIYTETSIRADLGVALVSEIGKTLLQVLSEYDGHDVVLMLNAIRREQERQACR